MKKCCIFGGCEFDLERFDYNHSESACIIAADKGYDAALRLNLDIDFVVGDFDSLGFVPDCDNVIRHSCEKDETDTALAVRKAFELGCDELYIYGAVGGRIDHSVANFQLICDIAKKGKKAYLFGDGFKITAVCNSNLKLDARENGIVSVFCIGNSAKGVNIKGLKYELCDYEMSPFEALGVSNEFIGKDAQITVSDGVLLIMIEEK